MKSMTFTTFVDRSSPCSLQDLLTTAYPTQKEAILSIQPLLADGNVSARKKMNAMKRVCGAHDFCSFKHIIEELCEVVETDQNVPILLKVLNELHISYPKALPFSDLVTWVYVNHRIAWRTFLIRSFKKCSMSETNEYGISLPSFNLQNYESRSHIEQFQVAVSTIFSPLGLGHYSQIIFDDYSAQYCRCILFLSPAPLEVMTCSREEDKSFKMRQNENAIKIVLFYDASIHRLKMYGNIPNRKARLELAHLWAETFIGGACTGEIPQTDYKIQQFRDATVILNPCLDLVKSVVIKSITYGDGINSDLKAGPMKGKNTIDDS